MIEKNESGVRTLRDRHASHTGLYSLTVSEESLTFARISEIHFHRIILGLRTISRLSLSGLASGTTALAKASLGSKIAWSTSTHLPWPLR